MRDFFALEFSSLTLNRDFYSKNYASKRLAFSRFETEASEPVTQQIHHRYTRSPYADRDTRDILSTTNLGL